MHLAHVAPRWNWGCPALYGTKIGRNSSISWTAVRLKLSVSGCFAKPKFRRKRVL
jgi:hypothetical protein